MGFHGRGLGRLDKYLKLPKPMNMPTNIEVCYVWGVFICTVAAEGSVKTCRIQVDKQIF